MKLAALCCLSLCLIARGEGSYDDEDEGGFDVWDDDDALAEDAPAAYDYDQDEFEGVPPSYSKKPQGDPAQAASQAGFPEDKAPPTYHYEAAAVAFILVYLLNYFRGKRANEDIVEAWYKELQPLFALHFARLGAYSTEGGDHGNIIKESPSSFKFYASGRRHCSGLLATIELVHRQDLFSYFLALMDMAPQRDTVKIEIPMDDGAMDPFVFCVCRRKERYRMLNAHSDLKSYTKGEVASKRLPKSLCVLTDCADLERHLLADMVVRDLGASLKIFQSLHFTDQSDSLHSARKLLRFEFVLPAAAQMGSMYKLTEMVMWFIDQVAKTRLSAETVAKAKKMRKQVKDKANRKTHAQRQEDFMRRKQEKKQRAEAELSSLSAAARKKRREKEEKRLKSKRSRRMVKIR